MRSKASAGVYKKAQKNAKLTANSGPLQKALLSMDAFNMLCCHHKPLSILLPMRQKI